MTGAHRSVRNRNEFADGTANAGRVRNQGESAELVVQGLVQLTVAAHLAKLASILTSDCPLSSVVDR